MAFRKFINTLYPSATISKLAKRHFPTVRSIDPSHSGGASPIVTELGFESLPLTTNSHPSARKKPATVAEILEEVKATDGLQVSPCHVEHLVGRATNGRVSQSPSETEGFNTISSLHNDSRSSIALDFSNNQDKYEMGGIDIAHKTQLVLQSPHPVRYVLEREMNNSQKGLGRRMPSYHAWIMLFGRSLLSSPYRDTEEDLHFEMLLNNIACASDAGMFSSDIHHTILDIPDNHPLFENHSIAFHVGNKYAVLVGDYFAIRCIYYAEKTKTNSVMVAITRGVEEFTTSLFGTNVFDKSVGYPLVSSPATSLHDWVVYNQKAYGYMNGGLYAALSLFHKSSLHQRQSGVYPHMSKFVANLSAFLKTAEDLDSLLHNESCVPSPFLLTSIPAIFCQMENPKLFANLRNLGYDLSGDHVLELHDTIRQSSFSIKRTRDLIDGFASESKLAFRKISRDQYYSHLFESLIDAVAREY